MRASTERRFVEGPAGRIECAGDRPDSGSKGAALIAHPHPQFGGTLGNEAVQALARSFVELGDGSWRPNFRGIGQSDGRYDEGRGEVEDLAAVFSQFSTKSVVLAGFSFGAVMQARLTEKLKNEKQFKPERLVLVGVAVGNFPAPPAPAATPGIHGERVHTPPPAAVLAWAGPDAPTIF